MENDGLVDPVEEFRAQFLAQQVHHLLLDLPEHLVAILLGDVAGFFQNQVRPHIGGHDDDGILKIHRMALAVGQATVFQHLQQDIVDFRMGLFDLIEQHHRIGSPPHRFGQLAAFIVADIAGRGPDQTGDRMALHIFRHVDAHHGILIIEEEFRQRPGQFGFAHPGGAKEDEGADRAVLVGEPGARTADSIGHFQHRFFLPHHPAGEPFLDAEELFPLPFQHPRHRDAGPARNDLSDLLLIYFLAQHLDVFLDRLQLGGGLIDLLLQRRDQSVFDLCHPVKITGAFHLFHLETQAVDLRLVIADLLDGLLFQHPVGLEPVAVGAQIGQFFFDVLVTFAGFVVLLFFEGHLLDLQLFDAALDLIEFLRHRIHFDAQLGRGFIDQVDRFIRQTPVGEIAVGKHRRRDQGGVGDLHPVMHLVLFLKAAQHRDGIFHRGLLDQDRLEAPLQGSIFFDIFAIFVDGRSAHTMDFTPGQQGLEHVGGIHRPLCRPGTHQSVNLVDKQDHLAVGILHFFQHRLKTLFEFAAEFRAGNQRPQVQGDDTLVAQGIGNVPADDALGNPLHHRGFPHPGIADQGGIVLGAPRKHLEHPADLLVAADHRIEFPLHGQFGEVAGIALQRHVFALRILVGHPLVTADLDQGAKNRFPANPHFPENPAGFGALHLEDSQQKMLRGDEFILQFSSGLVGKGDHLVKIGRGINLPGGAIDFGEFLNRLFEAVLDGGDIHPDLFQGGADQAFAIGQQGFQHMFGFQVLLSQLDHPLLGGGQGFLGFDGVFF